MICCGSRVGTYSTSRDLWSLPAGDDKHGAHLQVQKSSNKLLSSSKLTITRVWQRVTAAFILKSVRLGHWFSKWGSQARSISITWELVRDVDSQSFPGCAVSRLMGPNNLIEQAHQVILMYKFANPWSTAPPKDLNPESTEMFHQKNVFNLILQKWTCEQVCITCSSCRDPELLELGMPFYFNFGAYCLVLALEVVGILKVCWVQEQGHLDDVSACMSTQVSVFISVVDGHSL